MPSSSHTATIIVAVSSSVLLPSKQWDIVKTQLYHCWIQLYGPLFWIVSAMLCLWDTKTTAPYRHITMMEMPPSTTITTRHLPAAASKSTTPETLMISSEHSDDDNTKTNIAGYMNNHDDESKSNNKQHKKSLKRIIKNHIQTIKQRRQSLNEAVKRSVRRRPSQQHNHDQHNNRNINNNGLASDLHHATTNPHPLLSPPPRRRNSFPGTANMLLKPFRRKTAPAIFNNQKWYWWFSHVSPQKDGWSMVVSIIPFNNHMMIQQQVIGGGVPYLLSIQPPPPFSPPPSSPLPLTLARYTKTTLHLPCCRPCSLLLSLSLSRVKKTIVSSVKKFKPIEKHVLFYQKACSKN